MIDVAAIRHKVGGTQDSFARKLGVPAGTLRNWEHGRRIPTGAARTLLCLLNSDPEIIEGLLRRIARSNCANDAINTLQKPLTITSAAQLSPKAA